MTSAAPLLFHPLAFLDEGDEVVIGRPDIHSYAVFPPDGAALVRELAAGRMVDDAAHWYANAYGDRVDMDEFVSTLHELHLLRNVDEPVAIVAPVRYQRLGRALFSAPAWFAYAALLAAALLVVVRDDGLLPRPANVFFTGSLVTVAASVFAGQMVLTALHEAFHVLAARRLGVDSRVTVSRRLYFIVLETNLDGLAVVPRRRRYLPIMAGLLADSIAVCGLTTVAFCTPGLVGRLALALAFTTLPRMAWQLYLFLRTDIYQLIATATGCVDLDTVARGQLANLVSRVRGRPLLDEARWHPRDVRLARLYAPLLVIGYGWSIAVLAFMIVPLALRFWQSPVLVAMTVAQLLIALLIARRERRSARRSPT
jgi:hypothetical protein